MQNEPIEVTLRVTGILEKLGVPYVIGGSLASTLYGSVSMIGVYSMISDLLNSLRYEV
jgi:hypothetical protein